MLKEEGWLIGGCCKGSVHVLDYFDSTQWNIKGHWVAPNTTLLQSKQKTDSIIRINYLLLLFDGYWSDTQDTQHGELISVNLQSDGSDSLGLTLKFDDSEQLIVEEILSGGIADKVQLHASIILPTLPWCETHAIKLYYWFMNRTVVWRLMT